MGLCISFWSPLCGCLSTTLVTTLCGMCPPEGLTSLRFNTIFHLCSFLVISQVLKNIEFWTIIKITPKKQYYNTNFLIRDFMSKLGIFTELTLCTYSGNGSLLWKSKINIRNRMTNVLGAVTWYQSESINLYLISMLRNLFQCFVYLPSLHGNLRRGNNSNLTYHLILVSKYYSVA